jgi:hypothetical protein
MSEKGKFKRAAAASAEVAVGVGAAVAADLAARGVMLAGSRAVEAITSLRSREASGIELFIFLAKEIEEYKAKDHMVFAPWRPYTNSTVIEYVLPKGQKVLFTDHYVQVGVFRNLYSDNSLGILYKPPTPTYYLASRRSISPPGLNDDKPVQHILNAANEGHALLTSQYFASFEDIKNGEENTLQELAAIAVDLELYKESQPKKAMI